MKKLIKYFSIVVAIILVTAVVVAFFNLRSIFNSLTAGNQDNIALRLIDKLKHQEPAPAVAPVAEETIQILEGWTSRDIGQYFERKGKWQSEEFLEVAGFPQVDYRNNKEMPALKDRSKEFTFLADKPKYYGLEGYLFPDTYRIYASSTVEEVIEKMLDNFDAKLTDKMRAEIKKQGKSVYDIITMASIIEKEAPLNYQKEDNREARIISGIFWNRLEIGQGLQSDATLSYIFGDNNPTHSGKDLDIDSPYNTYKYRGLPPGPICNPGILAIEAAIYPIQTDYYYFLTPLGKDEVIYARTYEEHLKNKYQYLR
jgi:UPF0755 protein